MMFDYMLEVNDLKPKFEEFGLNEEDLAFIKEQIHEPKKNYKARGKEKRFLYEVRLTITKINRYTFYLEGGGGK